MSFTTNNTLIDYDITIRFNRILSYAENVKS